MKRLNRLLILLGVLLVACIATFALTRYEEKKEEIRTSGETVLALVPEEAEALSWTYDAEDGGTVSLSFRKDTDGRWLYDGDEDFPVSEERVNELLEVFEDLRAAFTIENADDLSQYGLSSPVCEISLTSGGEDHEIQLGAFSVMDEQRYLSTGDGNVYLAEEDPFESYEISIRDMIAHDSVPKLKTVSGLDFSGEENYSVYYEEESADTYCEDDVYFTKQNGRVMPLDTDLVKDYLSVLSGLDLTDYVAYNVSDEDLASYGLDSPELIISADYAAQDDEDGEVSENFTLSVSRDPKELEEIRAAAEAAAQDTEEAIESEEESSDESEGEDSITAYARVGDSRIVYQIGGDEYTGLMAASYNDLRHRDIMSADSEDVTGLDIDLDGDTFTVTRVETEDEEKVYHFGDEELDIGDLWSAIQSIEAEEFTDEKASGTKEISLRVYLDDEKFPEIDIEFYRYDGEYCLAVLQGETFGFVPRSDVVDLIEEVHKIVL